MEPTTRELVRRRADDRCEYCRLPQEAAPFVPFHVEHVRACQHGGTDDSGNLAWSCHRCNAYKGPNIAAIDPHDDSIAPLFDPRREVWSEHFRLQGAEIVGLTPKGRATLQLLRFNDAYRIELREAWLRHSPLD
jgi:hypothetical protein